MLSVWVVLKLALIKYKFIQWMLYTTRR